MTGRYLADDLDRGILRLLQIDARRPFSALAADLGVSDQTVARRYQQLRSRAGVQVIGVTQPNFGTQEFWLLRARAGGDLATLATNLARRTDTGWVHLVSGPTTVEIVSMVRRKPDEPDGFPLLEQLAALPSVTGVTAHSCLRMFFGGPDNILTKADDRTVSLRPVNTADLPREDQRLLAALEVDGRANIKDLSQASGLSPETVAHRLASLEASGTIYFDVDFDPRLLGLQCSVGIWATIVPAHLEAAGLEIATHQEISFAAATTGRTNLYAVAHAADADAMYLYLTEQLARLPGLQDYETTPHLRFFKMARRTP